MDLASDLMALRFLIEIRYGDSGVAPLITKGGRSNLRLSVIATGICRQYGWAVCRLQWEQSVASRLERHQTHSAKNDGKSISPAINPGGLRAPGFLFWGCVFAWNLVLDCLATSASSESTHLPLH
jgi:hypothetical protein